MSDTKGLCKKHYARFARTGRTDIPSKKEILLSRVEKDANGCWNYTKYLNEWGYGRIRYNGRKVLAHRLSYQLFIGDFLDYLLVCHKCDNPACINPEHLFLGTAKDNHDDAVKKGRINVLERVGLRWKICPTYKKGTKNETV